MEVISYSREGEGLCVNGGDSGKYFFIPAENKVFCRVRVGLGNDEYVIFKDGEILKEARALADGKDPYERDRGISEPLCPVFLEVKRFDYDESRIRQLLDEIRLNQETMRRIDTGIEGMLKTSSSSSAYMINSQIPEPSRIKLEEIEEE